MLHPSIACKGQSGKFTFWYWTRYTEHLKTQTQPVALKEAA